MKIALLVPNFAEYSGDARVVDQQAEELISKNHDVTIFAFAADFLPRRAHLQIIGMPGSLFVQRIYRLFFFLDILKFVKWLPKIKNFDCVVVHLYPMTWFGYLGKKLYKFKYIFWYHGIENPNIFPKLHERIYMHLHLLLTKWSIRNADRFISVSNFARNNLKSYTGFDSKVIYNKIDTEKFHKGVDPSILRKKLNLENSTIILNVGRIGPQKGVHLLIQAFYLVKKEISNANLVIIGNFTFDDYGEMLRKISDNSVIFMGQVSKNEMPVYYSMCDIYATCSLWENHNIPVLEAQTCGKSVIAFDIEAFEEEIDSNGILVKKGDVEKFAKACIKKIRMLRENAT